MDCGSAGYLTLEEYPRYTHIVFGKDLFCVGRGIGLADSFSNKGGRKAVFVAFGAPGRIRTRI